MSQAQTLAASVTVEPVRRRYASCMVEKAEKSDGRTISERLIRGWATSEGLRVTRSKPSA